MHYYGLTRCVHHISPSFKNLNTLGVERKRKEEKGTDTVPKPSYLNK